MQFTERHEWIPFLGISYHLAVDGISVLFVGTHRFSHLASGPLCLGYGHDPPESVLHVSIGNGSHGDGNIRLNRFDHVFCILGTHAHSQLFSDQTLGAWRTTPICGAEIRPLHSPRERVHARGFLSLEFELF